MIDIGGLDKRKVLKALYDNSKPQGMGFLHFINRDMTLDEAEGLLAQGSYFDYLNGRVMKVDLSKNQMNPGLYDRDLGPGAAERAIEQIR